MASIELAFIIPVHNRWDLAEATVRSFTATTGNWDKATCLLIDDASRETAPATLFDLQRPIRMLRNPTPAGFAASVNRAVRAVSEPLVVLLNSDLVLRPHWLAPMLAVLEAEPEAFAVGNVQTAIADGAVDHAGIIFHEEGYPIHFRADREFIEGGAYREFPAATAACLLVRRDRFLALGGFDESYRNGFEDVDLCLRARMRGWPTFVANHSWVEHHVSASPGRKDHEDANARRFLERWRPLSAVWQRDWEIRLLRERRIAKREITAPQAVVPATKVKSPLRVLVDLARLSPGGANGGIKVLVRETLRSLHTAYPGSFRFLIVADHSLADEVEVWAAETDEIWILPNAIGPGVPRSSRVRRLELVDRSLARLLDADVLYCPLGVSDFLTPDIPVIGVAVDLLHRELPECLPARDVLAREAWFDRMVRTSFRIQCNSHWVADLVQKHFSSAEDQLFVVYNALQNRLPPLDVHVGGEPRGFLVPANAWPHKNHDTLLVAYRIYRERAGSRAWPLVLTGHPDEAMERVLTIARVLGLGDCVDFRGYVSDLELRALWARAGALVFPSLHEGFGIPLLEAMHFGVPILAGSLGSIPEVAGDAFLEADVRSPHRLAAALARMSSDGGLRADLIQRGRARASAFDFTSQVASVARSFCDAADQFRRAGITWQWETHGACNAHCL